jgi:hypothetical protein
MVELDVRSQSSQATLPQATCNGADVRDESRRTCTYMQRNITNSSRPICQVTSALSKGHLTLGKAFLMLGNLHGTALLV